jgi:NAD(P)H dehydrogenase (quinone)
LSQKVNLGDTVMPQRILITGATGTVGGALLRRLAPAHREGRVVVSAGARSGAKRERLAALGVATVHLDYEDAASVNVALANVDRLFLITGYSVDMLMQSKTVLDAARRAGVTHVVHLGAAGSNEQPYAHLAWHAYVERYIEALGFGYTHLQPRTYMHNVLRVVRPGSTVLRQFFGNARLAWIDTDDIAAVAAAALLDPAAHRGATYHLAAEILTMSEVTATIATVTGIPFTYEPRDPSDLLALLLKSGMEPVYAASLAQAIGATARGENPAPFAVTDTIEKVTGRPATRWVEFATRHRERFLVATSRPA